MRRHPRVRPGAARRETSPAHFRKPDRAFSLAVWHLASRTTRPRTTITTATSIVAAAAARACVCDEPGSPRIPERPLTAHP